MNTFEQLFQRLADLQCGGHVEVVQLLAALDLGESALLAVEVCDEMRIEEVGFAILWLAELREKLVAGIATAVERREDLELIADSLAGIELPWPNSPCLSLESLFAIRSAGQSAVPAHIRELARELLLELGEANGCDLAPMLGDLLYDSADDLTLSQHLQQHQNHRPGCFALALLRTLCR